MKNLRQKFEFVRHIPPDQIIRRIYLVGKRRLLDRGRPRALRRWEGRDLKRIRTLGLHAPHGRLWRERGIWSACFLNEKRELGAAIDWYGIGGDAHDQLWRMNLHYFEYLPVLQTSVIVELIDGWIDACRPRTRIASSAAWQPYTISLRISAWLEAWSSRGPFGDDNFQARFAASIYEQANYLASNLETDVRGNHLIKNIRALIEAAASVGEQGKAWLKLADRHLQLEIERQVLADGVHYERSPSYHMQVFADLLSIYANRRVHDDLHDRLKNALHLMAQAAADLIHPDGFPAQFGDSGLTMTVSPAACLGAFEQLIAAQPSQRRTFSFPQGGYFGARNGSDYLIVRMGPLGADTLMAHAQNDWGSFEWSVGGQRVIVDQGVFRYSESEERRLSRATQSHNTAKLDGAEQADFFGSFRCGSRPSVSRPTFLSTISGFVLEGELSPTGHHDHGRQKRKIELNARQLHVEDTVIAGQRLSANILLHPLVTIEKISDELLLIIMSDSQILIQTEAADLQIEEANWWPDMGIEQPTSRIVISGKWGIKMTFLTRKLS